MNYIGLDISKASTAMVIESNDHDYYFSYNTKDINYIWNKTCSEIVNIKTYDYTNESKKNYSESEINKLSVFSKISTDVINDIMNTIDITQPTCINIEGFSYGQGSSQIIDIVGISSCIRVKIFEVIPNITIKILAPKALKLAVCKSIYGSFLQNNGKKRQKIVEVVLPNKKGVVGGNFTKTDMYDAILDSKFDSEWRSFLLEKNTDITKNKSIPKPIEDINDAFLLKSILKECIES